MGISIVDADADGNLDYDGFRRSLRPNTKAVICTHASNLTWTLTDLDFVSAFCRENGLLLIVDAAQTAGALPIDADKMGIDVLCFTGHKGLMGPQGTGGLCVRWGLSIAPLKSGGSGLNSFSEAHPAELPESLEAGTPNAHGIAGLLSGIEYIRETGIHTILRRKLALSRRFREGVSDIPGLRIYGGGYGNDGSSHSHGYSHGGSHGDDGSGGGYSDGDDSDSHGGCYYGDGGDHRFPAPIVTLNIGSMDSGAVGDLLASRYGICVRCGTHCAPLAHLALGTKEQGAVRFSFSSFNTEDEIQAGIDALAEIARQHRG
jgi:selenocysteine lyase/cysteine desulfurase